jgi:hypothetical protein
MFSPTRLTGRQYPTQIFAILDKDLEQARILARAAEERQVLVQVQVPEPELQQALAQELAKLLPKPILVPIQKYAYDPQMMALIMTVLHAVSILVLNRQMIRLWLTVNAILQSLSHPFKLEPVLIPKYV